MLNLMAQVKSDETMEEINEILSDYFAHKAEEAIDKERVFPLFMEKVFFDNIQKKIYQSFL